MGFWTYFPSCRLVECALVAPLSHALVRSFATSRGPGAGWGERETKRGVVIHREVWDGVARKRALFWRLLLGMCGISQPMKYTHAASRCDPGPPLARASPPFRATWERPKCESAPCCHDREHTQGQAAPSGRPQLEREEEGDATLGSVRPAGGRDLRPATHPPPLFGSSPRPPHRPLPRPRLAHIDPRGFSSASSSTSSSHPPHLQLVRRSSARAGARPGRPLTLALARTLSPRCCCSRPRPW